MCGIAGIADVEGVAPLSERLDRMVRALAHRGPNGDGTAAWQNATLGHRRLAVFDLSPRGAQPMLSADRQVGITFNGAVYNFRNLREQLARERTQFHSDTDTEVLLNGYLRWGLERLVRSLRGMFAFAIWDNRTEELFLVRDRLGVKPLVYSRSPNRIAFASTASALNAAQYAHELDPQAVADYLEWGVIPEHSSVYRQVEKLPPATVGRWHAGQLTLSRYWEEPSRHPSAQMSFREAVESTEKVLLEATQMRTVADVPVGALLSGGIDSALVCWAVRSAGVPLQAFAFSSPGTQEDEAADARLTAAELGIPLSVLTVSTNAPPWEGVAAAYAEPFACASAVGMLRLAAAAKDHVTVLLTGDGGDDAFLGYPHHRFLYAAQRLSRYWPRPLASVVLRAGCLPPVSGMLRRSRHWLGYLSGGLGAFLRARDSLGYFHREGLLGERLIDSIPSSHEVAVAPGAGRRILDEYLQYSHSHQFVDEYLTKVDGATMYHALEARSPFLDHFLWEHAAQLPYLHHLDGTRLKAILRTIASQRISRRVGRGRKRGFDVPVGRELETRWSEQVRELLTDSELVRGGWISHQRLCQWRKGRHIRPASLWYLCVLESWLRNQAAS